MWRIFCEHAKKMSAVCTAVQGHSLLITVYAIKAHAHSQNLSHILHLSYLEVWEQQAHCAGSRHVFGADSHSQLETLTHS